MNGDYGIQKLLILFCLSLFNSSLFGQQFLWSTTDREGFDKIPIEEVTDKVLDYYDHYEYYLDGVGYSKENFLDTLKDFGDNSNDWKSFEKLIREINELSVFAIRSNLGRGSVILVFAINHKNVNMVGFTNNFEIDAIRTYSYEKEKFTKWFFTILN